MAGDKVKKKNTTNPFGLVVFGLSVRSGATE